MNYASIKLSLKRKKKAPNRQLVQYIVCNDIY